MRVPLLGAVACGHFAHLGAQITAGARPVYGEEQRFPQVLTPSLGGTVSILDFGYLVDLLIANYSGPNTSGSALFPFTVSNSVDLDLDAILIPIDGHPAAFLDRYQGPPDCIALGLVSGGWAAPIDSKVRPSAHPDAKRIVTAVVAGVDGTMVDRIRMPDGSVINPSQKGPGFGAIPDALRAALWRTAAWRSPGVA